MQQLGLRGPGRLQEPPYCSVPSRRGSGCSLSARLGALAGQLLGDEAAQALQVLAVELNVVVPGPLYPQRLHGLGTALVECQPVREVDHFILRAVDDEHRRRDLGHLLDAAGAGCVRPPRPPPPRPRPPRPARRSLGERVKAVGLLGVGEGDTHARGERGVQHHGGTLVARGQVHGGHRADALPVQDDAVRADAVPGGGAGSAAATACTCPSHRLPSSLVLCTEPPGNRACRGILPGPPPTQVHVVGSQGPAGVRPAGQATAPAHPALPLVSPTGSTRSGVRSAPNEGPTVAPACPIASGPLLLLLVTPLAPNPTHTSPGPHPKSAWGFPVPAVPD